MKCSANNLILYDVMPKHLNNEKMYTLLNFILFYYFYVMETDFHLLLSTFSYLTKKRICNCINLQALRYYDLNNIMYSLHHVSIWIDIPITCIVIIKIYNVSCVCVCVYKAVRKNWIQSKILCCVPNWQLAHWLYT